MTESVKIEEQRLQHLRKFLPTFCLKARADNTFNQYRYTFNAFCRWCDAFMPSISLLPAAEEHVASYIISVAKDYKSKEPITPDHLKLLIQRYRSDNLFNMRVLSICLLGFAGFLGYSELANIKLCYISFEDTHMAINIVRSKTDVYKEGRKLCIARTHCVTCPVHSLEQYLKMLDVDINSQEYLFR